MEKMQGSINKDPEELVNKHTETNNTIIEIWPRSPDPRLQYWQADSLLLKP